MKEISLSTYTGDEWRVPEGEIRVHMVDCGLIDPFRREPYTEMTMDGAVPRDCGCGKKETAATVILALRELLLLRKVAEVAEGYVKHHIEPSAPIWLHLRDAVRAWKDVKK